jgi:CubicO group peptidase (beta-lactamase class C family)
VPSPFPLFRASLAALVLLTTTVPAAATEVDADALARLVNAAEHSNSSALVVMHEGALVHASHWSPVRPIEAMSVTKSVVNLALGRLYTEGLITSLDQPVHEYFPEWKQGRKQLITLRHLLDHSSGLQNVPSTYVEIYPSPDFVRLALAAELSSEPGEVRAYNNKALNLIPTIVLQLTGKRIDTYLRDGLFAELGITEFSWSLDDAGNAHGMSGLQILPVDLARLGQLVLQRGEWNGRQLIAADWIEQSLAQSHPDAQDSGLLWFRIPGDTTYVIDEAYLQRLAEVGVRAEFIERVRPLLGRHTNPDYEALVVATLGEDWASVLREELTPARAHGLRLSRHEHQRWVGYSGRGYLGQFLVVYPEQGLVAVRMIEHDRHGQAPDNDFGTFERMVRALVP